jgi:hypothetical protein
VDIASAPEDVAHAVTDAVADAAADAATGARKDDWPRAKVAWLGVSSWAVVCDWVGVELAAATKG